ncbi:hypothetical protein AXE41_RS19125 [Acinetobacter baumannii]|uniref:C2H2-type domain-containing protein n=1 Tax=Acinetobacter baumannii TaxID=470 RepID=A0AB37A7C5_ACIBA|nr:hypothetical protein [Acinetobacter baumannii]EHU2405805.1 hypothetical protein [Acinetobacter baumannii]EHU3103688.1 hypothetical protein [Acinetobacter baumannii]EHU3112244.1 hypothetical protein [Acinetobacter baumannii]EIB6940564.1 hypothetical protein [Acinetobacter baumannii]EKU2171550.1 hypothetical protein [Acinetobacter baumannii]
MTIKYYDLDNKTPIVVDLTLGELTDIYFTIFGAGGSDNMPALQKIRTKYTPCDMCQNLILKEDFEAHLQQHWDEEE